MDADSALREAQRIAQLGSYTLDVASGRWTSSAILDEILGIADVEFERDVSGWLSLVHSEDRAVMQEYFARHVLADRAAFDREYRIVRRNDGVVRWVRGRGELIISESGSPVAMFGTIQDTTDRKNSEEAMRAAHQRLAAMFNSARDAIILADIKTGIIVDANKEAETLLNRRREAIIGLHQSELYPPDKREACRNLFLEHQLRPREVLLDVEVITSDGRRVPVEVSASTVPLPDGGSALQGIFRDVTERKRSERILRERDDRLASVFRAVPVGICVVLERKFVEVNRHMTELTGYTTDELIGHSTRMLFATEEEYERVGRQPYLDIARLGTATLETTWRHKSGHMIEIFLSAADIAGGENFASGTTFAAVDITERRRLERQFLQAQKLEAVGQLAGGVAHDFNNILTAITLQLEILRRESALPKPVDDSLVDIQRQAYRAAELTRQLLLFSRRQVMQSRAIDTNELVEQMLRMLRRVLGENITIDFRPATDAPTIEADPGMVEQLVMNLCVNARDAMPQGGVLTISTERVDVGPDQVKHNADARPGAFLRFSFSDTGCGMAAATRARIFEPFFTTKEIGKGTGLGLASVFGIVHQHQGWIEVESQPDRGSTFCIHLPASARRKENVTTVEPPDPVRGGHESILLVEDEPGVRRLMATVLRGHGYDVTEAATGAEALALWESRSQSTDLLITDMVMPGGLTGIELAERLVARDPKLRVMIVSGYTENAAVRREASIPALVHVQKPCDATRLARTVRTTLDTHLA